MTIEPLEARLAIYKRRDTAIMKAVNQYIADSADARKIYERAETAAHETYLETRKVIEAIWDEELEIHYQGLKTGRSGFADESDS
jgi:hypothetical protein